MPKLVDGISQKMKNFCHEYLECGNATEAYLKVYNTNNRNSARQESSNLLKRDDITEYLAEISKPIINKITNEREKKRQIIWERIELCRARDEDAAIARYMDILNKMDSEYVNINRNVDDTGEKLATLSTEQLKNLLDKN
jgi:phage terminase small subunit